MVSLGRKLAGLHDALTSASFALSAALLGGIAVSFCYEVAARYFFAASAARISCVLRASCSPAASSSLSYLAASI